MVGISFTIIYPMYRGTIFPFLPIALISILVPLRDIEPTRAMKVIKMSHYDAIITLVLEKIHHAYRYQRRAHTVTENPDLSATLVSNPRQKCRSMHWQNLVGRG